MIKSLKGHQSSILFSLMSHADVDTIVILNHAILADRWLIAVIFFSNFSLHISVVFT